VGGPLPAAVGALESKCMEFLRRLRRAILCVGACVLLSGCVISPSGWDARTDAGRYDPGPNDPYHDGQPGVEDMRSGSQNDWTISIGGD
jgi:hypothetical protein